MPQVGNARETEGSAGGLESDAAAGVGARLGRGGAQLVLVISARELIDSLIPMPDKHHGFPGSSREYRKH